MSLGLAVFFSVSNLVFLFSGFIIGRLSKNSAHSNTPVRDRILSTIPKNGTTDTTRFTPTWFSDEQLAALEAEQRGEELHHAGPFRTPDYPGDS